MWLGIDVSTTASKALLLDEEGVVRAVGRSAHTLQTPRPGWSEQSPDEWWRATQHAIREACEEAGCTGDDIRGVGLSGQMHGLVALDGDQNPIRPAILWNDGRAADECDLIRARLGLGSLIRHTGNDAFAGFTAPKLLWMRTHEPDLFDRIQHVLLPKDYIRLKLSGELATDRAGAGGTLLLDLESRDWSEPVLKALELPMEWFPRTYEGTDMTGRVSADAARLTGLKAGTPIVAGGGDQAAQAVGVGAIKPDVFALTIGTSGVVFAPTEQPFVDPHGRVHAFPNAIPDMWHVMGVMLSAAGSLQWYRDTLAPGVGFDELIAEADSISPGSEGLTFLPYLSGERTPHANPNARGAFIGLSLAHSRGHLTRAVLEGVAFGLKDNLELLRNAGLAMPAELRASGGAMGSALWGQILSDVLAISLVTVDASEGAALGAAMLAGTGCGGWANIDEAAKNTVRTGPIIAPSATGSASYSAAYERFTSLYPALHPSTD